jgi:hypothetical protein
MMIDDNGPQWAYVRKFPLKRLYKIRWTIFVVDPIWRSLACSEDEGELWVFLTALE